jgi:ABC-type microcin C transport system permease subunit YejE
MYERNAKKGRKIMNLIIIGAKLGVVVASAYVVFSAICGIFGLILKAFGSKEKKSEKEE